jgi:L-rhamnonate dehydratase
LKLAAYATVHDRIVILHGHSTPMSIRFAAAQSPIHSPFQEYLVKWNAIHMHFLKNALWPVDGSIAVPSAAGANMDLDSAKIERQEDVSV